VWRARVVYGGLFRSAIVARRSPKRVSVEGGLKSVGPCGERPSVLAGNQRTELLRWQEHGEESKSTCWRACRDLSLRMGRGSMGGARMADEGVVGQIGEV